MRGGVLGRRRKALFGFPRLSVEFPRGNDVAIFAMLYHQSIQEVVMSRTVRFAEAGGPEVLRFVDESVRGPGRGEVRINVKAIGLNRAESMWRTDQYIEPVRFPAGLGYEAAGIVDAVGEGVGGFAPGDEVNVIPSFSMNQYFTYGEVIIVPDHAVVRHPKSLSFAEAASVWMMFVTAYGALIEDAKVGAGDYVVIPAASSSVGLAAIQLANYAGATSIAVTRHAGKRQQLLDAGAAHVVVTDESDLVEAIMRITDGKGARVAFDPVGGPNFAKLVSALSFQGIAYLYGALDESCHDAARAADDRQNDFREGAQHLADEWRPDAPKGCGGVRAQGARKRLAEAGHRSHLWVRRDRRRAPLPRNQRAVRKDRGNGVAREPTLR
ncbi:NADPH:quinone reductase-like Zn-dependent oxidoreductase [Paraburkholderia sp. RAU6.4a]